MISFYIRDGLRNIDGFKGKNEMTRYKLQITIHTKILKGMTREGSLAPPLIYIEQNRKKLDSKKL